MASVYSFLHSFVSFITFDSLSMSVVFFLRIANAKFNPIDIRAATIIAENRSGKIGCLVYAGASPGICKIRSLKYIFVFFHVSNINETIF